MCTTVDLPQDIHWVVTAIAQDSGASSSETVTSLLRAALAAPGPVRITTSARTGLQVASIGRVVTSQNDRSLDDDE